MGGEEEEKRGGEAIRCGSAQPLAMTKWSNYAWRLWHWLWRHLFCWSVKKQTYSIMQDGTHSQTDAGVRREKKKNLPAEHVQGHGWFHFDKLTHFAHTDASLAGVSVSQHRSAEGRRRSLSPSGCVRICERTVFPERVHHLLLSSHLSLDTHTHAAYALTKYTPAAPQPSVSTLHHMMLRCIAAVSRSKDILISHKNESSVAPVYTLARKTSTQALSHVLASNHSGQ